MVYHCVWPSTECKEIPQLSSSVCMPAPCWHRTKAPSCQLALPFDILHYTELNFLAAPNHIVGMARS